MTETYDKKNHWYGWNGGQCPVDPKTRVEYMTYHNGKAVSMAGKLDWVHEDLVYKIIAFRITKLPVDKSHKRLQS